MSLSLEAPPHLFAFSYHREGERVRVSAAVDREAAFIIHVVSQDDVHTPMSPLGTYERRDIASARVAKATRERDAFRDRVDALCATLHKLRIMGLSCGENGEARMPEAARELVRSAEAKDAAMAGQMADDGYNFGRSTR